MRNLTIEVYQRGKDKKTVLAASFLEAHRWLGARGIKQQDIWATVDSLIEQAQDPNTFPNVLLFLDERLNLMTIEAFNEV